MYLGHTFHIAYAVAAFAGALLIGSCGHFPPPVHAQATDYAQATQLAVNTKLIDQMAAGQVEINKRMDGIESRLNDISDRVSTIQGAGAAILVVLGALQILGLIQTRQANKGAP